MKYRRWTFGVSIEVDPDRCRRCRTSREGDGRHMSLAQCTSERLGQGPCPAPEQHHAFQRAFPIRVKREDVW